MVRSDRTREFDRASMTTSLRVGLHLIGALFAGIVLATNVHAQKYPDRAISIVVPYPPGGPVRQGELAKLTGQALQR
jgi:tripartite-type tricarboxylate transporter receptor subunit TctC